MSDTTLADMAAQVAEVNRDKGWYDDDRSFYELIALLHSEVSEALEAYREGGLEDRTLPPLDAGYRKTVYFKPKGVGSEFADVLIRLLDMSKRYGIDLDRAVAARHGIYGMNERFGDAACVMHMHISRLAFAADSQVDGPDPDDPIEPYFARIYRYLDQWSQFIGIDLKAEYERKLAYNRTRSYSHGGKKL